MLKMDGLTNQTVSIQAYFKLKKLPVTSGNIPVTCDDIRNFDASVDNKGRERPNMFLHIE